MPFWSSVRLIFFIWILIGVVSKNFSENKYTVPVPYLPFLQDQNANREEKQ